MLMMMCCSESGQSCEHKSKHVNPQHSQLKVHIITKADRVKHFHVQGRAFFTHPLERMGSDSASKIIQRPVAVLAADL